MTIIFSNDSLSLTFVAARQLAIKLAVTGLELKSGFHVHLFMAWLRRPFFNCFSRL